MSYTELGLMIFFKHSHFLPECVTCYSEKPFISQFQKALKKAIKTRQYSNK